MAVIAVIISLISLFISYCTQVYLMTKKDGKHDDDK